MEHNGTSPTPLPLLKLSKYKCALDVFGMGLAYQACHRSEARLKATQCCVDWNCLSARGQSDSPSLSHSDMLEGWPPLSSCNMSCREGDIVTHGIYSSLLNWLSLSPRQFHLNSLTKETTTSMWAVTFHGMGPKLKRRKQNLALVLISLYFIIWMQLRQPSPNAISPWLPWWTSD